MKSGLLKGYQNSYVEEEDLLKKEQKRFKDLQA